MSIVLSLSPIQISADNVCNHVWSDWKTTEEPTCGDDGLDERYCLECDEEEYEEMPATGDHEWDVWYTSESATISKTGLKARDCPLM